VDKVLDLTLQEFPAKAVLGELSAGHCVSLQVWDFFLVRMLGYLGVTGPGNLCGTAGSSRVCCGRACWVLAGNGTEPSKIWELKV